MKTRTAIDTRTGLEATILELRSDGWATVRWATGIVSDVWAPLTRGILRIVEGGSL